MLPPQAGSNLVEQVSPQGSHSQWRFDSHRDELVLVEDKVPVQPRALDSLCASDEASRLPWPDWGQAAFAQVQQLVFVWACAWAGRWGLRRRRGPSAGSGGRDSRSAWKHPFLMLSEQAKRGSW